MKKIGCILVFLYLMPLLSLKAVNAYPFPVSLKLPDGTSLAVRIYGDEHFSYRTTADGHFIAKGADGFYYMRIGTLPAFFARVNSGHTMLLPVLLPNKWLWPCVLSRSRRRCVPAGKTAG